MSFALTTEQARAKTKTVTRRLGWANLRPGERIQQVVKSQGLKKGEKVEKIHVIEIIHINPEPIGDLFSTTRGLWPQDECRKEGFPDMHPGDFVRMFCKHNGCDYGQRVNRIEFKYI